MKIFTYLVLWCVVFSLSGCEKHWNFSVINADKNHPEFCLSSRSKCTGEGIQLNTIIFQKVEKTGVSGKHIWMIEGHSNNPADYHIKTLTYGVTPPGWIERQAAEKILNNVYYSVNEEFYFIRDDQGNYRVLSRDEFFQTLQPPKIQGN